LAWSTWASSSPLWPSGCMLFVACPLHFGSSGPACPHVHFNLGFHSRTFWLSFVIMSVWNPISLSTTLHFIGCLIYITGISVTAVLVSGHSALGSSLYCFWICPRSLHRLWDVWEETTETTLCYFPRARCSPVPNSPSLLGTIDCGHVALLHITPAFRMGAVFSQEYGRGPESWQEAWGLHGQWTRWPAFWSSLGISLGLACQTLCSGLSLRSLETMVSLWPWKLEPSWWALAVQLNFLGKADTLCWMKCSSSRDPVSSLPAFQPPYHLQNDGRAEGWELAPAGPRTPKFCLATLSSLAPFVASQEGSCGEPLFSRQGEPFSPKAPSSLGFPSLWLLSISTLRWLWKVLRLCFWVFGFSSLFCVVRVVVWCAVLCGDSEIPRALFIVSAEGLGFVSYVINFGLSWFFYNMTFCFIILVLKILFFF
jgi:hypothetical protein